MAITSVMTCGLGFDKLKILFSSCKTSKIINHQLSKQTSIYATQQLLPQIVKGIMYWGLRMKPWKRRVSWEESSTSTKFSWPALVAKSKWVRYQKVWSKTISAPTVEFMSEGSKPTNGGSGFQRKNPWGDWVVVVMLYISDQLIDVWWANCVIIDFDSTLTFSLPLPPFFHH